MDLFFHKNEIWIWNIIIFIDLPSKCHPKGSGKFPEVGDTMDVCTVDGCNRCGHCRCIGEDCLVQYFFGYSITIKAIIIIFLPDARGLHQKGLPEPIAKTKVHRYYYTDDGLAGGSSFPISIHTFHSKLDQPDNFVFLKHLDKEK